jgi:hypothetical protein
MARPIEVQSINPGSGDPRNPCMKTIPLLPGAIAGVETTYYRQAEGMTVSPARDPSRGQVLLFTRGTGEAQSGGDTFSFREIAALCVLGTTPITITATVAPVEYLEILIDLQAHEAARLRAQGPFFRRYSHCEAYAEAIKSPKTISRTIVPAKTLPRFCMGSVETFGPDTVGAHAHPMLEQLFWGLPANACVVTADGTDAAFGDGVLLHIPLGSWHGVRVEEGRHLHYVWMDFFRNEEDLTYIREQHQPIKGSPSPNVSFRPA